MTDMPLSEVTNFDTGAPQGDLLKYSDRGLSQVSLITPWSSGQWP